MSWTTVGIVALLTQMPFLVSAFLISPPEHCRLTWEMQVRLIGVWRWSRWPFAPASVVALLAMGVDGVTWWLLALSALIDAYVLSAYWHAGYEAVDFHEGEKLEELFRRDYEQFRIDNRKDDSDV